MAIVVMCLGCSALTGPGGYQLPEEDLTLEVGRLAIGVQYYYCGRWDPRVGRPTVSHVLADVFFTDTRSPFLDHPLSVQRLIVELAGGVIVRTYRLPGFRVWLPTDSVPGLSEVDGVIIRSVPNPRRYDIVVDAYYGANNFKAADSARIQPLGGSVQTNFNFLGQVVLQLPERSLPSIRSDSRVRWITAWPEFLCVAPTNGRSDAPLAPISR